MEGESLVKPLEEKMDQKYHICLASFPCGLGLGMRLNVAKQWLLKKLEPHVPLPCGKIFSEPLFFHKISQ